MDHIRDHFDSIAKIILIGLAALIPIWFLPLPVNIDVGREATFILLIAGVFIVWLLSILTRGTLIYPSSLITWAAFLLLAVFGASAFYSSAPYVSLLFAEPSAEKFSVIIAGVVLMLVVSSVFRNVRDIRIPLYASVFSGAVTGVITILQLLFNISAWRLFVSFAENREFNVVGTMNGLSLLFAILFMIGLGLLFSSSARSSSRWVTYGLGASLGVFMLNFFLIHFWITWIVLLGTGVFFLGLMFMLMQTGSRDENAHDFSDGKGNEGGYYTRVRKGLGWRFSVLILLITLSGVMISIGHVSLQQELSTEVSPSLRATAVIASQVFKEGSKSLLLGSGPGTFIVDWSKFRDPSLNQTLFWNIRFTQGFSWLSTVLVTSGILGAASMALFILLGLVIFLRSLIKSSSSESKDGRLLAYAVLGGFVALILTAVLYPATTAFVLLFFLMAGFLLTLLARRSPAYLAAINSGAQPIEIESTASPDFHVENPDPTPIETGPLSADHDPHERMDQERTERTTAESSYALPQEPRTGVLDIQMKVAQFGTPWAVFVSSLIVVFFLVLGVAAGYRELGILRATLVQAEGNMLLEKGNIEAAIERYERASRFEEKDYHIYQNLLTARTEMVSTLIQQAVSGKNVQQEFQSVMTAAIQNSQTALALFGQHSLLWRMQGNLYELLIPFLPGSEKLASESYHNAVRFDPLNPLLYIDIGRAKLTFADRLILSINAAQESERSELQNQRVATLEDAANALGKASELKRDLAAAYFLLTQAALRMGNIEGAITNAENAKITAPSDIGIAFQLGLLYYHTNQLDSAQLEFERAVTLNANYSNARYFLGVIYDRKGDKQKAIGQFEHIRGFNPGNQEVRAILANLREGKSAFEGIVPPNPPPENRRELPVNETRQ